MKYLVIIILLFTFSCKDNSQVIDVSPIEGTVYNEVQYKRDKERLLKMGFSSGYIKGYLDGMVANILQKPISSDSVEAKANIEAERYWIYFK